MAKEPKKPEIIIEKVVESQLKKSQKEILLELYETLKSLNIRSLSDLENLIARAE